MIALSVVVALALAAVPSETPPPTPAPGAAFRQRVLPFGSPEARAAIVLGAPTKAWAAKGFQWRRYRRGTAIVELGFYRDKLGQVAVNPNHPMTWAEAEAWARAFVPGFDAKRLRSNAPGVRHYFETVVVDGAPFEIELTFKCEKGRVAALFGEMHWLD